MKVRFTHFEYQPLFRQSKKHALRVTLGLTDTEHYALMRLGNVDEPLFRFQMEDAEFLVTIGDCLAGARLDFETLLQANEAQNRILRGLEKLEVTLQQDVRGARVDTVDIPSERQFGLQPPHAEQSERRKLQAR